MNYVLYLSHYLSPPRNPFTPSKQAKIDTIRGDGLLQAERWIKCSK